MILDGFRIRYTNGDTAQVNFFLSVIGRVFPQSFNYNRAGAILTDDFLTDVALGNVSNYDIDTKFGRNPEIDTTTFPEDIWNGGGEYTGHPTNFVPETMAVYSSSANDAAAGTGARTVEIIGLQTSASTEYTSEIVTLNGTTSAETVNSYWRVNRAAVNTVGSGGENAGSITITPSTSTSNVMAVMPAGFNQTQICAYTVPALRRMLIKKIVVSITRASGAAGSATITLRVRDFANGGDAKPFKAKRSYEIQTGGPFIIEFRGGIVVEQLSDLKIRVDSVSDNDTIATASFEYILLNNETS